VKSDGADMFFAYASVVDEHGTVVYDTQKEIIFTVTGDGILISPERVQTQAGIASALIRTSAEPGQIIVSAETSGLKKSVATLKSFR